MNNKSYIIHHGLHTNDKLYLITPYDTITYHIDALITNLLSRHKKTDEESIPRYEMTMPGSDKEMETRIELSSLTLDSSKDSLRVTSIDGRIFIQIKAVEMK